MLKRKGIPHHILNAKKPRARSRSCGPGRQVQSDNDLDEHGRPRYRTFFSVENPGFLALSMSKGEKGTEEYEKALDEAKKNLRKRTKNFVIGLGGFAHPRYGEARIEAHRQPVARDVQVGRGDPGSSRFLCIPGR